MPAKYRQFRKRATVLRKDHLKGVVWVGVDGSEQRVLWRLRRGYVGPPGLRCPGNEQHNSGRAHDCPKDSQPPTDPSLPFALSPFPVVNGLANRI